MNADLVVNREVENVKEKVQFETWIAQAKAGGWDPAVHGITVVTAWANMYLSSPVTEGISGAFGTAYISSVYGRVDVYYGGVTEVEFRDTYLYIRIG